MYKVAVLRTFYVHENAAVDLSKIYFLKNTKKTCKPNNLDLNRDWISIIIYLDHLWWKAWKIFGKFQELCCLWTPINKAIISTHFYNVNTSIWFPVISEKNCINLYQFLWSCQFRKRNLKKRRRRRKIWLDLNTIWSMPFSSYFPS